MDATPGAFGRPHPVPVGAVRADAAGARGREWAVGLSA